MGNMQNIQFYGRWKASERLLVRSAIRRAEGSFRRELQVPWVVQRTYQGDGSVFYLAQREGSGRPLVAATAEALAFHILSDARRRTENLAQKKAAVDGQEWPLPR